MMERPSLSTRGGDEGATGLFGGRRLPKFHPRIHAYGTIDELNAVIGLVLSESEIPKPLRQRLMEIQKMLFVAGADLASPEAKEGPRIGMSEVKILEQWGVELERSLPALKHFILPSGSRSGSLLHLARTVCRRAERWLVSLREVEPLSEHILIYLNRLSDFLFLAARSANEAAGAQEMQWRSGENIARATAVSAAQEPPRSSRRQGRGRERRAERR